MKIKLFIVALLLPFCVNAQKFQGKATYKTHRKMDVKLASNGANPEMQKQLEERMKKQFQKTFILSFNKSESIYKEDTKLSSPKPQMGGIKMMVMGSSGSDILYKNIQEKRFSNKTEIMGKRFLIKDTLKNFDWKLSSETKNIGNYTCYKATYSREIENKDFMISDGKLEEVIKKETKVTTAWYTTKIPISNGPEEFGGLPGLILEINDGELTIVCTEIVINPTEKIDIQEPTKGKEVTQKTFDEIRNEKTEEMMERFKSKKGLNLGNGINIRMSGQ